jgi:hypothetical protein
LNDVDGDTELDLSNDNVLRVNGWALWVIYIIIGLTVVGGVYGGITWWRNRKKDKAETGKILIRRRFPKGERGLWVISRYLLDEDLFRSQLDAAGPQREMILDKYKNNIRAARQMQYFATGAMAVMIAFMSVLPLGAALNLSIMDMDNSNVGDVLFATSMAMGFYFVMSFMILLVFGLLFMAQLMKGDIFKLLATLPLARQLNRRMIIYLLIRMYGIPFVVVLLFYPIGGFIITGSIVYLLVSVLVNFLYLALIFFIMVLLTDQLSRKVYSAKATKSATMVRVAVMAGYLISMMFVMLTLDILVNWVGDLYVADRLAGGSGGLVNTLVALVPFPFAGGYITAMSIVPLELIPTSVLGGTLGGFLLLGATVYAVRRRGNAVLERVARGSEAYSHGGDQVTSISEVVIDIKGPRVAMIKHSLVVTSRDMGSIMYLIMPIIFPLILVASQMGAKEIPIGEPLFGLLGYMGVMPFLINMSLSTSDANTGGVLSSLPFSVRDQFRARQAIIIGITLIPFVIVAVSSYSRVVDPGRFLSLIVSMGFIMVVISSLYLIVFSRAFGLVNGRYTFFMSRIDHKMAKYVGIVLLQYLVGVGLLVTFHGLFQAGSVSWVEGIAILIGASIVLIALFEIWARRMFPSQQLARS